MMQPLYPNILLERDIRREEQTASGLVIVKNAEEESCIGTVLETYDGCESVKKGDVVRYKRFAGSPVEYEKKNCLMVEEEELLAIITNG